MNLVRQPSSPQNRELRGSETFALTLNIPKAFESFFTAKYLQEKETGQFPVGLKAV